MDHAAARPCPTGLRGDAADFPDTPEWSTKGLAAFKAEMKAIDELEERRLAYVALTRAKDTLVVTGHWWGPTQKKPRGPSPYLEEVYAHCLAGHGTVAVWTEAPEAEANPWLAEAGGEGFTWPLAARRRGPRRAAARPRPGARRPRPSSPTLRPPPTRPS